MIKDESNFGSGSFVGDIMSPNSDFFELPAPDQARYLGWVAACPVVEELIDSSNTAPGRGAEAMIGRYGAVAFWHGFITREILNDNPALSMRLKRGDFRPLGEIVGKYEPQSVPEGYDEEYSAVGKLVGFALPRMLIDHIGLGEDEEARAARLRSGVEALQDAASWSKLSEEQLLARTAEGLAKAGTPPEKLLKHIAGQGWLDEHNGKYMFDKAMMSLREYAPSVWAEYESLSDEQRKERKLADFDPLNVEYEPTEEELQELFDGLSNAVKRAEVVRPSRSQTLNEFKHQTDIMIMDAEARQIMQDEDTESVEVSLIEPTDRNYKEWSVGIKAVYGQPDLPGRSSATITWTLYKTTSMSRGDQYDLHKFPAEMRTAPDENGPTVPALEAAELTTPEVDLEEDFYEDNATVGPDDIAMLNRLIQTL